MIKRYLGLVIIFAVQHQVSSLSADVHHRLAHRKDKMKRLQDTHNRSETLQDRIENYDLIVTEPSDTALTKPVLRHRHRHYRHRSGKGANVTIKNQNPHISLKDANIMRKNFNLTDETNKTIKEDKAATTAHDLNENRERGGEKVATTKIQEQLFTTSQKPVTTNQNVTLVVPFYRRLNYLNDQERNKPQKWVHCLDLISPRLKGYEDKSSHVNQITSRHGDVKRLSELLSVDVSRYTEEEIVSVLYQISNLDLRLFHWDYTAITTILNVIIRGSKHNFLTLKAGVKYLFKRWHLDISSINTFLDQTRIFRPPCIDISGYEGNTKKAGGVILFTKPDKPTKKHRGDESCHSREKSAVDNKND